MLPARDEQGAIPSLWYALLALTVVVIAVTGWLGFLVYPRMGLPAVEGAALLVLASAAGVAAFFSPCSFPLLVTILSREIGAEREADRGARTADALRFALALSIGAATFLLLAGVAIAAGSGGLIRGVTFGSDAARLIRGVVGTILIALGLVQLGVIDVAAFHRVDALARPLQRRQAELRRTSATLGYAVFGFGYILAGFGWTGPILVGLASHALAIGDAPAALVAFVTAAASIVVLMFSLSLTVGLAQERTVKAIRARAGRVKRWGGYILVAVGLWTIALAALPGVFRPLLFWPAE